MPSDARPVSVRRRLLSWLLAASLFIGIFALFDTRAEAIRMARDISDRVLAGSAHAILERVTVTVDGGVSVEIPFSALDMLTSTAQDQVFYRVDGPAGILTGYADLVPATVLDGATSGFADDMLRGTPIRKATVQRELTTGEGLVPVSVTVAESTLAREGLAGSILARSALRLAVLIAASAVVAWVATTVALRPLDRLGRAISDRAPQDLNAIAEPAPVEVWPVLEALNGFLARLKSAVAALQSFSANANHQIRTPLTVARTQIALARRSKDQAAHRSALAKADAALVRADQVLAQLLLLARIEADGARPALSPIDLAAIARSVTEELVPESIRTGHDLGFEGPAKLVVTSERVLLGELLRNLIGNALQHTPEGTEITLAVFAQGEGAMIRLTDDGPALPDEAFQRLQRALDPTAETRVRHETHGLGLLIVRDISAALGATLKLSRGNAGQGLVFTVEF